MNAPEDNDESFALLRDLPVEVSLDQVAHMVAAFPLAVGAMAWLASLKTNLNTILMMTTGTLLIGTAIHFMAFGTPEVQAAPEPHIPEIQAPAQVVEVPQVVIAQPAAMPALQVADPARAQTPAHPLVMVPAPPPAPLAMAVVAPVAPVAPVAIAMAAPVAPVAPLATAMAAPVAPIAPIAPPTPAPLLAPAAPLTGTNDKTYDLRDFNAVSSFSSADISIEEGPWKVTASGDPDLLDGLEIVVENGVLKVSMKNHKTDSFKNKEGLKVDVHLPQLTHIDQGGSGNILVGEFNGTTKDLAVNVMGSGDIDVKSVTVSGALSLLVQGSGDINCRSAIVSGNTTVSIMGSGDVKASGTTATIEVTIQGSGDADVSALQAQTGKVSILGSGDASLNCTGKLERLVQGSGSLIEK